jgi:hypothetical protein
MINTFDISKDLPVHASAHLLALDIPMSNCIKDVSAFFSPCAPVPLGKMSSIVPINASEFSLGQGDVCNARPYWINRLAFSVCRILILAKRSLGDILSLGHRFSPSRDLRRKALVKRFATMPLLYAVIQ